jgi:DNA-binding NarL/FixJ family response regulator
MIPSSSIAALTPIRVVVVEDDLDFQNALLTALVHVPDIVLAGAATSRSEGLSLLAQEPADVLLVDLGLPDGSGIDVIRAARERWPTCAVMVCTVFGDEGHVMRAIEAGATGYLLKDTPTHRVADLIRTLHSGGSPISPMIARKVLMRFQEPASPPDSMDRGAPGEVPPRTPKVALSARESQVLSLITKGFTAEEIGNLLGVSHHTVLSYVRRIYTKLEVSSKAEAIFEARAMGLLGY